MHVAFSKTIFKLLFVCLFFSFPVKRVDFMVHVQIRAGPTDILSAKKNTPTLYLGLDIQLLLSGLLNVSLIHGQCLNQCLKIL